jgi:phosphoglucomutase
MGGHMSASAAVLSLLQAAHGKGQLSASSLANAGDWLRSGALPAAAIDSLRDLCDRGAWAELEDRFYKGIAFGTGGMRGRTVGRVSAANEVDAQGLPVRAALGSACLNDVNVLRAVIGLWKHVAATQPGARLVVAHDVRHFSRHFAELIAGAWSELGGEAYLFAGARSTPQLSFTVRHLGAQAGVVITASHNPSHDNGFKCCLGDGGQVLPPHDAAIVAEVGKLGPADVAPYLEKDLSRVLTVPAAAEDAYLARLAGVVLDPEVISRHTPKVVFTNVHGTGDVMVVPALRRVGIDPHVVEEQREHDGRFPTVASPNPENASTFALALKLADEIGADLILATDPDSDRVGVACPLPAGGHRLLNGNEVAALLTEFRLSSLKDAGILPEAGSPNAAVVKSLVTTPLVAAICARHGVRCVETLVGFKWIARKLQHWSQRLAEGAGAEAAVLPLRRRAPLALRHSTLFLLGAEESYGYLADDAVRDKDANATVIMLCEFAALLRSRGRTLLDALDVLHLSYGAHHEDLLNLSFEGAEGAACIRRIVASWRAAPPAVIDGSKVVRVTDYERDKVLDAEGERVPPEEFILAELADGRRIAVRASGTEPKAKFYSFTKAEVADADDLPAARERARKSALALRAWLEADAKRRAK